MTPWVEKLVQRIEHNLQNRALYWDDVDPEIQEEIRDEMAYEIASALSNELRERVDNWLDMP